ncbi:MAG: hypothetical protein ACKVOU_10570 [Cytophagales bacterium]
MKKIVLAVAMIAFVGSAVLIAGGDKEKDKKACTKSADACCAKKKSGTADASKTTDKKTEVAPK